MPIEVLKQKLKDAPTAPATGRVLAVQAQTIRASLPAARVGDMASIERRGEPLLAEIVGFGGGEVQLLSLGDPVGGSRRGVFPVTDTTDHDSAL